MFLHRESPADVLNSIRMSEEAGVPAGPNSELVRQASTLDLKSGVVCLEVLDLCTGASELLLKLEHSPLHSLEVLGATLW